MKDKIKERIKNKYNLEIEIEQKFSNVFSISFVLQKSSITITYMYDIFKTFESNMKEIETRINKEILDYYIRKKVKYIHE